MDSFEEYIDEVKKIEKKVLERKPYSSAIEISNLVDMSPEDYLELTYDDLLNLYERMQKITKASMMLSKTLAAGQPTPSVPSAEKEEAAQPRPVISKEKEEAAKEVEENIKKITQETMETAQKIKEVELPSEEKAKAAAQVYGGEIEFEREFGAEKKEEKIELEKEVEKEKVQPPIEREIEREQPEQPATAPEREIEIKQKEEEHKEERKGEGLGIEKPEREKEKPEIEIEKEAEAKRPVAEEVDIVFPAPTVLESPDKAAQDKYAEIEKEVLAAVGEGADEAALKKKMLELTKELFKEKSTVKREHIKLEITVLKNILAQKKAGALTVSAGKGGRKTKAQEAAKTDMLAHMQLFETIVATQKIEIAQTKDSIIANYKNQVVPLRSKFEKAIEEAKNDAAKKEAYDSFVFQLTSLVEHTPAVIDKYKSYLKKKHAAEIANIEKSAGPGEKELLKKIEERKKEIENYDKEFEIIRDIISKEIETLIRRGGHEIFKKAEAEKTAEDIEEEKVDEILAEIQSIDEGNLLFYLHSKDPEYYKKYERRQISKAEALSHSKALLAREKGLSGDIIKKYFSNSGE